MNPNRQMSMFNVEDLSNTYQCQLGDDLQTITPVASDKQYFCDIDEENESGVELALLRKQLRDKEKELEAQRKAFEDYKKTIDARIPFLEQEVVTIHATNSNFTVSDLNTYVYL